jgi:Winged helix DNA-binding domain
MIPRALDIAACRLSNQRIASPPPATPGDVVSWLGAVQAQDYLGALWAVGLRMREATEAGIERALADRSIVRTWPMRGTLHFVAAADVRWMLELMTPRIVARNKPRLQREFDLDDTVIGRSRDLSIQALQGGRQLTRDDMYEALEAGQISARGQRGLHILWWLAQEGLLCFGAREGKQQTFVLLDEWVPQAKTLQKDEALAELARRYFTSHGPATLQDFAWWSGLTTSDASAGLDMAGPHLVQETIEGRTWWFDPSMSMAKEKPSSAHLLPAYDEYTVAYKDRNAVLDPVDAKRAATGNGIFYPILVIDGQVMGTWKRTLKRGSVVITPRPFRSLSKTGERAVATAARRYGAFLGIEPAFLEVLAVPCVL